MPSGSKSYHTRMGIRVDLPQEHEPHTALHLRLIPGGTTGPEASKTLRGWNHVVPKRWRFVVGVLLLKRNTKTQNSPLPYKTHPSGGKFHQRSPTWISLTQPELFRYVQRFQRHCTSSWNDAMHKGCCACRSSTSPSVPVKNTTFGAKAWRWLQNNLWTHTFSIYRRLRWSSYHPPKNYHHIYPV